MGREHEHEDINRLEYEETELRLGLPGASGGNHEKMINISLKRGFSQTLIDLKLNLSASMSSSSSPPSPPSPPPPPPPPPCHHVEHNHHQDVKQEEKSTKPPAKAQVVGWPPVRAFRKNILSTVGSGGAGAAFVKVSLDGAPYLRKVDLKMYNSYQQLSDALGKMFGSFTIGNCGCEGLKDFMSESKLIDLLNGSDYVPTYEDKDGDWMLVGDVPWEMFVDSCKRLRIMKSSEAIGLAPRAVEKCKNRV